MLDNSQAWSPIDFADMFRAHLSGITWSTLRVASGEAIVPSELLEEYDIFVLTGSRFNVRDRETLPWFDDLVALIKGAAAAPSKRVYGGCFGCQVIAVACGGRVDFNPVDHVDQQQAGRRKFVLGAELIEFKDTAHSLLGNLGPPPPGGIKAIVSHGDCVLELPPDADLLASSASCSVEAFVAGPHRNLLAFQSHPEFDYDYAIRDRIWLAVVLKNKRLTDEEQFQARASFDAFEGRGQGPDLLMGCIQRFLLRL